MARCGSRTSVSATKGRGRLHSANLGPWLMTAAVPMPGLDLFLPTELEAELDYRDGLLVLTELDGEFAGTRLSGELNAETRDGVPHLTGEAHLSAFGCDAADGDAVRGAGLSDPGCRVARHTVPAAGERTVHGGCRPVGRTAVVRRRGADAGGAHGRAARARRHRHRRSRR